MIDSKRALVGYTGFVGSTLMKQANFDSLYRSTNIQDIRGLNVELLVCAGAPAQKWLANADPEADRQKIDGLIKCLSTVTAKEIILLSTVDVFAEPRDVDEHTPVNEVGLHAYGLHRRMLEKFVIENFPMHLIVRLPGLVGPGLRKNVIFDFHNDNNLSLIESRGMFQFYPMVNLWWDIERARQAGLRLLHLTAEPISVSDIALQGFGRPFTQKLSGRPVHYDMQTHHSDIFGGVGRYQYSARDTVQAIRSYAQSEPCAPRRT